MDKTLSKQTKYLLTLKTNEKWCFMVIKVFLCLFLLVAPVPLKEEPVLAKITQDCMVYSDKDLSVSLGTFYAGCFVEILQDYSQTVYKVAALDSVLQGWVKGEFLEIPPDKPTDKSVLSPQILEDFIADYTSDTNYIILTDINRQQTHVFKFNGKKWRIIKSFDCSTGLNVSPTTRGIFKITDRGPWFYSERLGSGAKYWMRFNSQYLFHSTPMNKEGKVIETEDVVGIKLSSGCVRLLLKDAKWLYDNVPDGSSVIIK